MPNFENSKEMTLVPINRVGEYSVYIINRAEGEGEYLISVSILRQAWGKWGKGFSLIW